MATPTTPLTPGAHGVRENHGNYQKSTYLITKTETPAPSPPLKLKRLRHLTSDDVDSRKKRKLDDDADVLGNLKDFIVYENEEESESESESGSESQMTQRETENSQWKNPEFEQEYQEFLPSLSTDEQTHLHTQEHELIQAMQESLKPIKYQILTTLAPLPIKMIMMSKFKKLLVYDRSTNDFTYELSTLQQMLQIPWGVYADLPITKTHTPTEIQAYLLHAMQFLNSVTYGQAQAKSNLLLELSRYLENPSGHGFILGVKGPPGSGKTTLISQGLAHLLNRPFFRVDLGGAKHSDCLFGSRKVFDRSDVGDLVKILTDAKCMNPIIFFDELDKVSLSDYGQELINALNDLTDTNRNHSIVDQYLGVPLDLSRAIFVFAYNSSDHLQETLKSRIHEIEIEPYSLSDKVLMAQQFFIPNSCQKLNLDPTHFHFTEDALRTIITQYTQHEDGVRELERRIDEVILKINWIKLTQQGDPELIQCYSRLTEMVKVVITDQQYQINKKLVLRLLGEQR